MNSERIEKDQIMSIKTYGNLIQQTRLGMFNSYFVRENDGLTLIDTNMPGSTEAILKAASEIGGAIKRIVITHAHSDHAADLDKLKAQLPDADVLIAQRELRFLQGDTSLDSHEPNAELRGSYVTAQTKPARTLVDGDMVGSLRVIAAPGHTPGHIALLDTRDNTLIAGDAYVTQAGITVSGEFKLLFPFPAMATWHKPTALKTARALRQLNPSRLAVGHGRVLENPAAEMDKAIRSAEQKFPAAPVTATH